MLKKITFFLFIIPLSFSANLLAQTDAISFSVETTTDSVWAFPAFITASQQNVSIQKIPNISTAEKQWEQLKGQNKKAEQALALLDLSDAYIAFGKDKQAYNYLCNLLELRSYLFSETSASHLYYNMAVVLSHLKQYPLALSAFLQTKNIAPALKFKGKRRKFRLVDSVFHFPVQNEIVTNEDAADDQLEADLREAFYSIDSLKIDELKTEQASEPIAIDSILNAFDDGKAASSYAVTIHIKQPAPGKKKVVSNFTNVGHMFITLIKYNEDETTVSRSFGLYPETGFLFSATPIFPKTEPLFKNDAGHDWDEMLGKFVSKDAFHKILDYIDSTSVHSYHLNNHNCSDFALQIGAIAGIEISATKANWVIGKGNSPASAGQSVLAAKYKNLETNTRDGLLVCTNNLFLKTKK